jgi:hypothetical protein
MDLTGFRLVFQGKISFSLTSGNLAVDNLVLQIILDLAFSWIG